MRSTGRSDGRAGGQFWAAAFILGGVILLLFNFNAFAAYEPTVQYVLTAGLVLVSAGFFAGYLSRRAHWWRLIPGWTVLALAAMVYLTTVEPLDQRMVAATLFLGQALAFAHVYLLDRQTRWWAIIPGGFMLVVSAVIALSVRTADLQILGMVLFVGMGAVFLLLYLLESRRRLWWALIPGSVLVVFGLFLWSSGSNTEGTILRWWPILLILLGVGLGWRSLRRGSSESISVNQAPGLSRHGTVKGRDRSAGAPEESASSDASTEQSSGARLGDYNEPAPGSSIEVLSEDGEDDASQ